MNRLFLLLFGMVTFVAHAQVPDYVPTDGLVVWYPLDGDATDFGPFNIQPEYAVAEPAANRFEQEGRALSFIGDEDFIQGHADLFPVTDRTLSFWFNMPLDSPENWLIGYGGGASGTSTLLYSNSVQCNIGNSLAHSEHGCQSVFGISLSTLQANVWHHCVLSSDSLGSLLYIDGTIASNGPALGSVNTSNRHFFIGGGPSPDGEALEYNFHGQLDEVGIWNRSLTDTEIQGLFTSVAPIFGCTDPEACNYSTLANIDDESCHYPLIPGDCNAGSVACADGTYWNSLIQQCVPTSCPTCPGDGDGDLVIGVSDLLLLLGAFGSDCPETGCTDSQATNYNPNVVINDGSCVYPPCLDAQEPGAACDDGNPNTFNTYWDEDGCLCEGSEYVAEDGSGPCDGLGTVTYQGHDYQLVEIGDQCWFRENCKFLPTVSPGDVGSEDTPGQPHAYVYGYNGTDVEEAKEFAGRYDTYGVLYNHYAAYQWQLCPVGWHEAMSDDWRNLELALGLPDSLLASGGGAYGTDLGTQIKSNQLWDGTNSSGFTMLGAGYREVSGNFHSLNYSGHYRGFSPSQPIPPNGHGLGTQSGWTGVDREYTFVNKGYAVRCVKSDEEFCFDPDGNGICADNEVFGCIDETACNYDATATHDDGSCIPSQEDGSSCDDEDANTFNDAWDAESCMCAGTPAVAEDGSGPCEGALTVNYNGYDYATVQIGEQCWLAENLRTELYSNGDTIPGNLSNEEWASTTEGAQAISIYGDALEMFGRAYNGYAVGDERGLCLSGWHVALDSEWKELEMELGMSEADANSGGWRGTDQGIQMKTTTGWSEGENGTNSSGFSAKPAGNRTSQGHWTNTVHNAFFWTPASSTGSASLFRHLRFEEAGVFRGNYGSGQGLSIRCLKD